MGSGCTLVQKTVIAYDVTGVVHPVATETLPMRVAVLIERVANPNGLPLDVDHGVIGVLVETGIEAATHRGFGVGGVALEPRLLVVPVRANLIRQGLLRPALPDFSNLESSVGGVHLELNGSAMWDWIYYNLN